MSSTAHVPAHGPESSTAHACAHGPCRCSRRQVGPLRMATWQVSVVRMFFRPLWVVTLAFCLIFAF